MTFDSVSLYYFAARDVKDRNCYTLHRKYVILITSFDKEIFRKNTYREVILLAKKELLYLWDMMPWAIPLPSSGMR